MITNITRSDKELKIFLPKPKNKIHQNTIPIISKKFQIYSSVWHACPVTKAIAPPSNYFFFMILAFLVSLDMIYIIGIVFWSLWFLGSAGKNFKSIGPKLFLGKSCFGPKYFRAEVYTGPKYSLGRSIHRAEVFSGPKLFRAKVFPGRSECWAKAVSGPNWVWAFYFWQKTLFCFVFEYSCRL